MEKLIDNMNDPRWHCEYDVETGRFEEIYDEFFNIKTNDIGFYIKIEDTIVGVVNHFRGPLLFVDNRRYFLKELNYEFIHTHLPHSKGQFQLFIDGKENESLIYTKPSIVPNPWYGDDSDLGMEMTQKKIMIFSNGYVFARKIMKLKIDFMIFILKVKDNILVDCKSKYRLEIWV